MILVLCLLAVLMLLPYVLGPVLVHRQFRHRKEAELGALELSEMPPDAREYLEQCEAELADEGFEHAARARVETVPDVTAWVSILVHHENRDVVQVAAVARELGGDAYAVEESQVEFMTQWKGREVLTNNSAQVVPFGFLRGQSVARFVDMDDIVLLYRIHRARVREEQSPAIPLLPEGGLELNLVTDAARRFVQAQVARGNFRLLEGEGMYGLTWRGAYIATMKHLWPFQGRALRAARDAAQRLVKTLDLDVPDDQVTPRDGIHGAVTSQSA